MAVDGPAMISIRVVSYLGAEVDVAPATFDGSGGSIGRAEGNRLVLADPDRTISRVHAEIIPAGGGRFTIVNRGGNAIALNGSTIESGGQQPIAVADELQIGGYLLRVAAPTTLPLPAGVAAAPAAIPADWDPFAVDEPSPVLSRTPLPEAIPSGPQEDPFHAAATTLDGPLSAWEESAPPSPPVALSIPATLPPAEPPPPVALSVPRGAADRRAPAGAMLSWTQPAGDSFIIIQAAAITAANSRIAAAPNPSPSDLSTARTAKRVASDAGSHGAAASFPPATFAADPDALALAWREGLGAEGLPDDALRMTPALLRLAARLLREAATGTIDLLAARAALKREIRAEMTMIAVRENNPLKFSSSVDIALAHLLGSPERGFMSGEEAMRDAYQDLRAHQFATLTGMRAALEGIFARFDPAVLEGRLAKRSVVDSLVPSKRKARLWELFNEMYSQLATEASDDFHELFGKAFLQAYEEHIGDLSRQERS